MSESATHVPEKLADVVEAFKDAQGREKLDLLLEFSESLPPLPERFANLREEGELVHECVTPVVVYAEKSDGTLNFWFDIPPEAPTVRGYAGLMAEGLNGCTPEEIIQVPGDFFLPMGLAGVISNQRMNGITAILGHMKRLAIKELEKAQA